MKEDIIQFNSYSIYDLVINGEAIIYGQFLSLFGDSKSLIQIKAEKTNEDPIETISWGRKVHLPSRLMNRPFAINHPSLGKHTFILKTFDILSKPQRRVPFLYKMLKVAKINKNTCQANPNALC
jgi:hypothetical protein